MPLLSRMLDAGFLLPRAACLLSPSFPLLPSSFLLPPWRTLMHTRTAVLQGVPRARQGQPLPLHLPRLIEEPGGVWGSLAERKDSFPSEGSLKLFHLSPDGGTRGGRPAEAPPASLCTCRPPLHLPRLMPHLPPPRAVGRPGLMRAGARAASCCRETVPCLDPMGRHRHAVWGLSHSALPSVPAWTQCAARLVYSRGVDGPGRMGPEPFTCVARRCTPLHAQAGSR
jgi:hypothetical protein